MAGLRPRFESIRDTTPADSQYEKLPDYVPVIDTESLKIADPLLYDAMQRVIIGLNTDMLPIECQTQIVESMSSTIQRELVYRIAGLDSSILLTFKTQMELIDAVLRKVVKPDGTKNEEGKHLDISVKEALNLSLKLTTAMSQHLPKIIKVEKVQRMENALFSVVETLPKEQQAAVLKLLEQANEREERR